MGVTRRSRSLLETNAVSRICPVFYGMLTALLIGHAATPAVAQPPDGNFLGERRVNAIMREILVQYRMVGASLAIAKDGQLLMARGYGLADVASGERATADTLFCTASVSKPFTAVAILKLVDQGSLALDARLLDVLSDLQPLPGYGVADPRFGTITVHKLLYHSGGWDRGGPPNAEAIVRRAGIRAPMSAELAYRVALSQPLAYTPGTEARYSNFGFVMLRLVVERAGGQRFEPFVKQNILAPMGITQMRLEPAEPRVPPGEAHRYAPGGRASCRAGMVTRWAPTAPTGSPRPATWSDFWWPSTARPARRSSRRRSMPKCWPCRRRPCRRAKTARTSGWAGTRSAAKAPRGSFPRTAASRAS